MLSQSDELLLRLLACLGLLALLFGELGREGSGLLSERGLFLLETRVFPLAPGESGLRLLETLLLPRLISGQLAREDRYALRRALLPLMQSLLYPANFLLLSPCLFLAGLGNLLQVLSKCRGVAGYALVGLSKRSLE